jgi:hypothetical protein
MRLEGGGCEGRVGWLSVQSALGSAGPGSLNLPQPWGRSLRRISSQPLVPVTNKSKTATRIGETKESAVNGSKYEKGAG